MLVHCITPSRIDETILKGEGLYNYFHSKTRIKIEQTYGNLKNGFQIFDLLLSKKGNVNNGFCEEHKNTQCYLQASQIIRACGVLHNMFFDLNHEIDSEEAILHSDEAFNYAIALCSVPGSAFKASRDAIKHYLSNMECSWG